MPSLHPDPGFDYYYKACKKGDPLGKAVTVNESVVRAIADASEITGLPRDNSEVHEISKEEFYAEVADDVLSSHPGFTVVIDGGDAFETTFVPKAQPAK